MLTSVPDSLNKFNPFAMVGEATLKKPQQCKAPDTWMLESMNNEQHLRRRATWKQWRLIHDNRNEPLLMVTLFIFQLPRVLRKQTFLSLLYLTWQPSPFGTNYTVISKEGLKEKKKNKHSSLSSHRFEMTNVSSVPVPLSVENSTRKYESNAGPNLACTCLLLTYGPRQPCQ